MQSSRRKLFIPYCSSRIFFWYMPYTCYARCQQFRYVSSTQKNEYIQGCSVEERWIFTIGHFDREFEAFFYSNLVGEKFYLSWKSQLDSKIITIFVEKLLISDQLITYLDQIVSLVENLRKYLLLMMPLLRNILLDNQ